MVNKQFKNPEVMEKISVLPIFGKSDNGELIQLDENSSPINDNPLVPGVKRFGKISFWIVALLVVAGLIFFLPTILKTIGLLIMVGIGIGLITFGSIMYPQVIRWSKNYADKVYMQDITRNPIQYINRQITKKIAERKSFGINKSEIKHMGENFELESIKKSKSAEKDRAYIVNIKNQADLIKEKMVKIENETSEPWKLDEYNELETSFKILMGDFQIAEQRLNLNESLSRRYAMRHSEFIKHIKIIDNHTIALDIYINKLKATGEMLKDELTYTAASKEMTNHSLSILGATSKDEAKMIINVITNKIEKDSAEISAGIEEISNITKDLNLNKSTDDIFERLSNSVKKIENQTFDFNVNDYKNPNYIKTDDDKIASSSPKNFLEM